MSDSTGATESNLGVENKTLEDNGAVSEPIVREMAEGAIKLSVSDISVAVSGVAGPDGGTADKPVGTVCIGLAGPDRSYARRFHFTFGRRLMNKKMFAMAALNMLRKEMLGVKVEG